MNLIIGWIVILAGFLVLFGGDIPQGHVDIEEESNSHYEEPLSYELCKLNDFYGPRCEYYRREGLAK